MSYKLNITEQKLKVTNANNILNSVKSLQIKHKSISNRQNGYQ